MNAFARPWNVGLIGTLAFAVASCGGGGGDDPAPPSLAGTVQFVPAAAPLAIVQNTPSLADARPTLALRAGKSQRVQGALVGSRDLLRLRSDERVAVRVRMTSGGDVRMAHQDPISLSVAEPASELRFLARGLEDVILHGTDGSYELDVAVRPLPARVALDGHLGAFLAGDRLELDADSGAVASFSCAMPLRASLRSTGGLSVLDLRGNLLGTISSGGGELELELGMLARATIVAVEPGALTLEAHSTESALAIAFVASVEAERAAFGLEPSQALASVPAAEFMPGELLVRRFGNADVREALAQRGALEKQVIPETSTLAALALPESLDAEEAARTTLAAMAAFAADPSVEWAEPNFIRRALGGGTTEPNDTFYNLQWHYDLIRLPQAWSVATGDPSVIVAVIDTGSRPHPDLDGNTIAGFDFISDPTIAADGDGLDPDPTDPGDGDAFRPSSFHGTHVAGTVGAVSNNSLGVAGVNWNCSLMHLRVLGVGGGLDADIAQSVRYAARLSNSSGTLPPQRARVINMSLGGPGSSSTMQSAVTAARNAGVVIVAAAGNENSSVPSFPASYTGVLSVAAVDLNANKASYSNFGSTIDLAAPGGDTGVDLNNDTFPDGVLSTMVTQNVFAPTLEFLPGTSMACPHVAGLAALMLDVNPALTVPEIETILITTTVDLGAPGRDDIFGNGLIQADRALAAAAGQSSATPVLSANPSALQFGSTTTQLSITIANTGTGSLDVGIPTFTPTSGGAFATLAVVAATGATDVSAITVTVSRTGLPTGNYAGTITIPSNGGTALVSVAMSVAPVVPPENVDLFLALIDASLLVPGATEVPVTAVALLNPTTGLAWLLDRTPEDGAIPAADYIVVCGSDDDGDNRIFEPEDTYRGAWPLVNQIETIPVAAGDQYIGVDFVVGPSSQALTGTPGWIPAQGFRIPARD